MNLKESFHYQNFLNTLMADASDNLLNPNHWFVTTKKHLRSTANPDSFDFEEVVDKGEFYCNDIIVEFVKLLIEEKGSLCRAIAKAKNEAVIDIDAAIEENKFRTILANSLLPSLNHKPTKKIARETDYKINAEGNQVAYFYDVDVSQTDAFDRNKIKEVRKEILKKSNEMSSLIEGAMVNCKVCHIPIFDVNDSFEDIMEEFIAKREE